MYLVHQPDASFTMEISVPPESVLARVRAEAAPVKSVQWSPALGKSKPFVAELDRPGELRMRVKHAYSNGFTRVLRARIEPAGQGTRLDLRFHSIRWVEWMMRFVWIMLVLPLGFYSGHPSVMAQAAVVAFGTVGAMLVVEAFGRWLGNRDEQTMRDALESWFGTRLYPSSGT